MEKNWDNYLVFVHLRPEDYDRAIIQLTFKNKIYMLILGVGVCVLVGGIVAVNFGKFVNN